MEKQKEELQLSPTPEFLAEYQRLLPLYNGALKTVCARFEILDDEFSILQGHDPIHSIEHRLKTAQSAYEKLPRRDLSQVPENLCTVYLGCSLNAEAQLL